MPDMETVKRSVVKLRRISAKIEAAMLEIDGVVAALGQSSRQRRLDRLERSLSRYEKM
ncbi:hypothetical protein [Pseudanabaena sp. PCC 6802]|uniref:hypothetical protein n=1 Tax=Pseudanabaena sp. PCC 6802 TaxID=118173 RepID=UPI0012EA9AF9|nr:hypothetical protein [Pseudanabaena sp. PCC 6802]